MNLIALGINHNSAAVEVRERVAFAPEQGSVALVDACDLVGLEEVGRMCFNFFFLHVKNSEITKKDSVALLHRHRKRPKRKQLTWTIRNYFIWLHSNSRH